MKKIDVKLRNSYNNCILRKIIYHQYLPMLIGISDQMGAQTDRLRCEVCQNLILSPMNTGLLRPAVTTVLTVHGIETRKRNGTWRRCCSGLQQSLPFTVLKQPFFVFCATMQRTVMVTTVLTVHGIETTIISFNSFHSLKLQQSLPFTVLKRLTHDA